MDLFLRMERQGCKVFGFYPWQSSKGGHYRNCGGVPEMTQDRIADKVEEGNGAGVIGIVVVAHTVAVRRDRPPLLELNVFHPSIQELQSEFKSVLVRLLLNLHMYHPDNLLVCPC